jgi:hypothetical protein
MKKILFLTIFCINFVWGQTQEIRTSLAPKTANTFRCGTKNLPWDSLCATIIYSSCGGNIDTRADSLKTAINNLVNGITKFDSLKTQGAILATGIYGAGWTEPNLGVGTRMMWYPRKAAFRVGTIAIGVLMDGTEWNDVNIGDNSFASGYGAKASGPVSTAIGDQTVASGDYATALGRRTKAESYVSFSGGRYNIGGGAADAWAATDPLVEWGNGTSGIHSAALLTLKNGNTCIGTTTSTDLTSARLTIKNGLVRNVLIFENSRHDSLGCIDSVGNGWFGSTLRFGADSAETKAEVRLKKDASDTTISTGFTTRYRTDLFITNLKNGLTKENVYLIPEPSSPVLPTISPYACEPSIIFDGSQCDVWYGSGDLQYSYATDTLCRVFSAPQVVLNAVQYPYVLKEGSTYYLFARKLIPVDNGIYLWQSSNKTTWTIMNGGNPVLTNSTDPTSQYYNIWNVAVVVVNGVWHMFMESGKSLDQHDVGLGYSYSTLNDMNWDTHRTAGKVIDKGGSPYAIYIPDRNSILLLCGVLNTYWDTKAFFADTSDNLALSASWHESQYFTISYPNMHTCDPHMAVTDGAKEYNIIIQYYYNQSSVYQTYSSLSLNSFFDAIQNGASIIKTDAIEAKSSNGLNLFGEHGRGLQITDGGNAWLFGSTLRLGADSAETKAEVRTKVTRADSLTVYETPTGAELKAANAASDTVAAHAVTLPLDGIDSLLYMSSTGVISAKTHKDSLMKIVVGDNLKISRVGATNTYYLENTMNPSSTGNVNDSLGALFYKRICKTYEWSDDCDRGSVGLSADWADASAGAGTVLATPNLSDSLNVGYASISTGTVEAGRSSFYTNINSFAFGTKPCTLIFIGRVSALSSGSNRYYLQLGFGDATATTGHVDYAVFDYTDSISLNWRCRVGLGIGAGGDSLIFDTGLPVTADTVKAFAIIVGGYTASFYAGTPSNNSLNLVLLGSLTSSTCVPNGTERQTGLSQRIIKTKGITARLFYSHKWYVYREY